MKEDRNHGRKEEDKPQHRADDRRPEGEPGAEEKQPDPLQKKVEEYEALWDKHLRLCAEFDNTRKRWQKEKEEVIKFGNFMLMKDLLVVADEMEQALKMIKEHKNIEEIIKGLDMMFNNFSCILKKGGLQVIEAQGKDFDPHFHEIVTTRQVDDKDEHKVLEEVQKGYRLEGKVLRTSKVIVGVKSQKPETRVQKPEEGE